MIIYTITLPQFNSDFTVIFDNEELLVSVDMAELQAPANVRLWFWEYMALKKGEFLERFKKLETMGKVIITPCFSELKNVTFEMFWNRYDEKIRSSKKKSLDRWNKLSKNNQIKAYTYINTYFSALGNIAKKNAETYLNSEIWKN